jgi:hypothetical protein
LPIRAEIFAPRTDDQTKDELIEHMANVLILLLTNSNNHGPSLKELLVDLERNAVNKAILLFSGHQAKTANFLHVLPTTLSAKLRKYEFVGKYKKRVTAKDLGPIEGGRDHALLGECAGPRMKSKFDDTRELPLVLKV